MAASKRTRRAGTPRPRKIGATQVAPVANPLRDLLSLHKRIRARQSSGEDRLRNPIALTPIEEDAVVEAYGSMARLRHLERDAAKARRRKAQIQLAVRRGARPVAEALAGLPQRGRGRPTKVSPFQLVWDYIQLTTASGTVTLWDPVAVEAGDNSNILTAPNCPLAPGHALEILANHHGLESDTSCRRTLATYRQQIRRAADRRGRWQGRDAKAEPDLFQALDAGLHSLPLGRDE